MLNASTKQKLAAILLVKDGRDLHTKNTYSSFQSAPEVFSGVKAIYQDLYCAV